MMKRSDYMIGRRQFVGGVVGSVGAIMTTFVGLPIVGYIMSPALTKSGGQQWISLGSVSALQPGVPTRLTFSQIRRVGWKRTRVNHAVYAMGNDGENITVMSDVCTHLSCIVHWDEEEGVFICPCHNGVFDKDGNVLSGPPPRPLDRLEAKIEDDQLMMLAEG